MFKKQYLHDFRFPSFPRKRESSKPLKKAKALIPGKTINVSSESPDSKTVAPESAPPTARYAQVCPHSAISAEARSGFR